MGAPVLPAFVNAVIQYYIADKLLDAQKEAREALTPIALESLEMAENLFDAFMELRAYDNQVYNFMLGLPSYSPCSNTIQRGRITGHFQQAAIMRQNAFGHSRYNCGNRTDAINTALAASIVDGGEGMVDSSNFEELLQDAYDALKYTSVANSAAFKEGNIGRIMRGVGESMMGQDEYLTTAANASLAGLGYSTARLGRSIFSGPSSTSGSGSSTPSGDTGISRVATQSSSAISPQP